MKLSMYPNKIGLQSKLRATDDEVRMIARAIGPGPYIVDVDNAFLTIKRDGASGFRFTQTKNQKTGFRNTLSWLARVEPGTLPVGTLDLWKQHWEKTPDLLTYDLTNATPTKDKRGKLARIEDEIDDEVQVSLPHLEAPKPKKPRRLKNWETKPVGKPVTLRAKPRHTLDEVEKAFKLLNTMLEDRPKLMVWVGGNGYLHWSMEG